MANNLFGKMLLGFIGSVFSGIGFYMMLFAFLGVLASSILASLIPNVIYTSVVWIILGIIGMVMFLFGMKIYLENINFIARLVIGLSGILIVIVGVMIGSILAIAGPTTAGLSLAVGIFAVLVSISMGYAFIHIGFGIKLLPYLDKMIDTFLRFTTKIMPKLG